MTRLLIKAQGCIADPIRVGWRDIETLAAMTKFDVAAEPVSVSLRSRH